LQAIVQAIQKMTITRVKTINSIGLKPSSKRASLQKQNY